MSRPRSGSVKKPGLKLNDADLLCHNECGYFGNPAWHGYCSVCYREVYLSKRETEKTADGRPSDAEGAVHGVSPALSLSQTSAQSFSKFEEKRKLIAGKGANTVKNIFRISKDNSRLQAKPVVLEGTQVGVDFIEYLNKIRKAAAQDITRQVKRIMEAIEADPGASLEQQSLLVHNFYNEMFTRINSHGVYKGMTEENRDLLMDKIERYLTTQLYRDAFCSPESGDEERDLAVQHKIRSLHWITPQMLDAEINEDEEDERGHIYEAITAVIEMDAEMAPQDKLACVARCCRSVFAVLRARGRPANADEFLPAIIWLVLRANPPRLQSNINFITRFANPSRLNTGEAGYFFTNLCCAVNFIEHLNHESLSMSVDEFERYMRGESRSLLSADTTYPCEGLRIMAENEDKLNEMLSQYDSLTTEISRVNNEMEEFHSGLFRRIADARERYPLTVRPRTTPPSILEIATCHVTSAPQPAMDTSIDEDLAMTLPPPLLPS